MFYDLRWHSNWLFCILRARRVADEGLLMPFRINRIGVMKVTTLASVQFDRPREKVKGMTCFKFLVEILFRHSSTFFRHFDSFFFV